jgi:D-alanyl-lipoteichoic acid acyltransferase DltB (MBOAT superfamily)
MSFNSFTFAVFFCLTYLAYWSLPRRLSNVVLLVASYVFYGWWDYRFLGLLAVSTVVDYCAGRMIDRRDSPMARRLFLTLSIATNLGILGVFKYANFFADSFVSAMDSLGLNADVRFAQVVLPVGISFYTFQTMSYTIDVYRREIPACQSFLDFALFVSFFPQLVAGPIERARVVLPQLAQRRRPRRDQFESACWLILTGFYLKCVIADNMAPIAQRVFDHPESVQGMEIVIGVWAAAFQIYGDFAGYSRIAIGVAKLFGIDLMTNFNRPYLAVNPSDFWRRWHISLSTWLRDYLYIPLGGSRVSKVLTYRNLMITIDLGGTLARGGLEFCFVGHLSWCHLMSLEAWGGFTKAIPRGCATVTKNPLDAAGFHFFPSDMFGVDSIFHSPRVGVATIDE